MNLDFTRDQARFCFAVMDAVLAAAFSAGAAMASVMPQRWPLLAVPAAVFAAAFAVAAFAAARGREGALRLAGSEPIGRARRRETYVHCVGPLRFTAHFDGFP